MNPLRIPTCCQLSWYSLAGYTAFFLQKSPCLGNELDSTAKRVAAYVPRILIAFPLLMTCAALDLVILSIQTIIFTPLVLYISIHERSVRDAFRLLGYVVNFIILFIALPLILAGHLLCGKIPRSSQANPMYRNSAINEDFARRRLMDRECYTAERILEHLEVGQKELDASQNMYGYPSRTDLTGSFLTAAVFSENLRMVDFAIAKGATLQGMDKQSRLNTLFYAFKGPTQILKRILELPDFNPAERFTVTTETFEKWPPWRDVAGNHEKLTNISLTEIAILSDGISGLRKLQILGWPIDYFELSRFQYFLDNRPLSLNTSLKTSIRTNEGNIEYFTELAPLSTETNVYILRENSFYKAWVARSPIVRSIPSQRNLETIERDKQNLIEIMQSATASMQALNAYFPKDLIPIIMSY